MSLTSDQLAQIAQDELSSDLLVKNSQDELSDLQSQITLDELYSNEFTKDELNQNKVLNDLEDYDRHEIRESVECNHSSGSFKRKIIQDLFLATSKTYELHENKILNKGKGICNSPYGFVAQLLDYIAKYQRNYGYQPLKQNDPFNKRYHQSVEDLDKLVHQIQLKQGWTVCSWTKKPFIRWFIQQLPQVRQFNYLSSVGNRDVNQEARFQQIKNKWTVEGTKSLSAESKEIYQIIEECKEKLTATGQEGSEDSQQNIKQHRKRFDPQFNPSAKNTKKFSQANYKRLQEIYLANAVQFFYYNQDFFNRFGFNWGPRAKKKNGLCIALVLIDMLDQTLEGVRALFIMLKIIIFDQKKMDIEQQDQQENRKIQQHKTLLKQMFLFIMKRIDELQEKNADVLFTNHFDPQFQGIKDIKSMSSIKDILLKMKPSTPYFIGFELINDVGVGGGKHAIKITNAGDTYNYAFFDSNKCSVKELTFEETLQQFKISYISYPYSTILYATSKWQSTQEAEQILEALKYLKQVLKKYIQIKSVKKDLILRGIIGDHQ